MEGKRERGPRTRQNSAGSADEESIAGFNSGKTEGRECEENEL